ncbi:MepB family protein [Staphylococcus argenteus]|uniref:MepB family protein n=1 Tax=Staphylococcus argenteus TaxID=985002 RepID=UPI00050699B2|nr:MepB family protein [Staphylococcus argenteus]API78391.1 multidrug transporter [Staphylococcus argenteus]MBE2124191.1 MepB family protein [Staphylococcus argenteus]MBE2142067.1 MepB family protein [Staphylococcus argenteus]MCG6476651.1 MepB family protein [Staphylococcus argenteus]MCG9805593.1 MepB family protein [Staphylococcus argenteus]
MYKSIEILEKVLNVEMNVIDIVEEKYNKEYEALTFNYKGTVYKNRLAKKTPNKSGYFVTCWTKDEDNYNRPYKIDEFADYLIVAVIDGELNGYFLFPKEVLVEKGILASSRHKGKMAFRVYPIWCNDLNKTAQRTQKWQCNYFFKC